MLLLVIFRSACAGLAIFASLWGWTILRGLPPRGFYGMAQSVQQGQSYDPAVLRAMLSQVSETDCRVETRRSTVILNLGLFDAVNSGRRPWTGDGQADRDLASAREAALALLRCAPSDGLGWLALYLVRIRQSGFGPAAVTEMAAAYRNAPHEAWLQTLRLPAVLSAWSALPPSLQQSAGTDFDELLAAGLNQAVATLIAGAPRARQKALLERLCPLPNALRATINNDLSVLGHHIEHPCLIDSSRPIFMR